MSEYTHLLSCVNFSHPTHPQGAPSTSNNAAHHKTKMCVCTWHVQISCIWHTRRKRRASATTQRNTRQKCVCSRVTCTHFLHPTHPQGAPFISNSAAQHKRKSGKERWKEVCVGCWTISFDLVLSIVHVCWCGVALVSGIDKIISLFCKRARWKRQYSAKETYNLVDPTNSSHPILYVFSTYTEHMQNIRNKHSVICVGCENTRTIEVDSDTLQSPP